MNYKLILIRLHKKFYNYNGVKYVNILLYEINTIIIRMREIEYSHRPIELFI